MTKNKASTVAEKVPKKPRREDTATADGGPTVEDEPTVVAPGCPEFIGGLVVSFCKRNGSVVLAAHHAPSTEQREGSRKAPCPAGPSFKADPHHTVEKKLEVSEADLAKMKELYAGSNDRYKGLEARLDELHGHMDELKKSLRVSYTALHQTATSLGEVEAPAFGDETSMTAALAELVTVLESVVPKYTSQMRETATTGVRIGAAHILACFRANYPELDLENILRHGEANSGHLQFAEEVAPIADSILPFYQG
nr:myosin heavy chain-like protein [Oryza sativa Japonica Group]BAD09983.1 myosin heavy chain-like protein [Oryza sativa Japonica Group]